MNIVRTSKKVFSVPAYSLFVIVSSVFILSLIVLLPNLALMSEVLHSSVISVHEKVSFLFSLYGGISTNNTALSAVLILLLPVLISINTALLIYYVRRAQRLAATSSSVSASISGVVSGVLGIGCAACGSIILTTFLATIGAGGLLIWLPLHGAEFGMIGVALLLFSIFYISKKIDDPLLCAT